MHVFALAVLEYFAQTMQCSEDKKTSLVQHGTKWQIIWFNSTLYSGLKSLSRNKPCVIKSKLQILLEPSIQWNGVWNAATAVYRERSKTLLLLPENRKEMHDVVEILDTKTNKTEYNSLWFMSTIIGLSWFLYKHTRTGFSKIMRCRSCL